jgi:hypothetical protein
MADVHLRPNDDEAAVEEAIATLWTYLDAMIVICMDIVDLVEGAQAQGKRLRGLRAGMAPKLHEAIQARDEVLAPFGIDAAKAGR